jgi:pyridoxamine 5'-phosphate oxidase
VKDLSSFRRSYRAGHLDESMLADDPFTQFGAWFQDAVDAGFHEVNAMTLATSTPDGRPSARIVLLKGFDRDGFVFFTHYDGRKGRELEANPHAALVFFWDKLERQVRIEGAVSRSSAEESDAYFMSRTVESRLASRASRQSSIIADRDTLDAAYTNQQDEHSGEDVPRPVSWGGYVLSPERVEFWQGGRYRMHDRLCYVRDGAGWRVERLMP